MERNTAILVRLSQKEKEHLKAQAAACALKMEPYIRKLIMGKEISSQAQDQLKDAAILGSVAQFPTRIKCAALAWHAAQELLE